MIINNNLNFVINLLEKLQLKTVDQAQVADILKLSLRQVKRKLRKYLKQGPAGLIHGNKGKTSNRKLDQQIESDIIKFLLSLKAKIGSYSPIFAKEKLFEQKNIEVSKETVRKIMIRNNLWKPKSKKIKRHYWRERKLAMGIMTQLDGSKHKWFNDQYVTLLTFVDDATSKILHAEFVNEETTESISKATKKYVEKYGRPQKIYVDRGKVFKVNHGKNKKITQYNRMLKELDIELIFAYSPQAKGRVERCYRTLQDRLVRELAYEGIKDMCNANKFLENYITIYNNKFSVQPADINDFHKPIDDYKLNTIFCIKKKRILKNDSTISYKNRLFLILKEQSIVLKIHDQIDLLEDFDGTINLFVRGWRLNWKEVYGKMPQNSRVKEKVVKNRTYSPSYSHPWRNTGERDKNWVKSR